MNRCMSAFQLTIDFFATRLQTSRYGVHDMVLLAILRRHHNSSDQAKPLASPFASITHPFGSGSSTGWPPNQCGTLPVQSTHRRSQKNAFPSSPKESRHWPLPFATNQPAIQSPTWWNRASQDGLAYFSRGVSGTATSVEWLPLFLKSVMSR